MNRIIKKISNIASCILLICQLLFVALILSGCEDNVLGGEFPTWTKVLSFTDTKDLNPNDLSTPEFVYADSSEQTITLHCSTFYSDMPKYNEFYFEFPKLDYKDGKYNWVYYSSDMLSADDKDSEGDYYKIWNDTEDGESVVKIRLKANNSNKERKFYVHIYAGVKYNDAYVFGIVSVVQAPGNAPEESFKLKAKYKGKVYSTDARIDSEGNLVYLDNDYKRIMEIIDSQPNIRAVIMDNDKIYYYDDKDIEANMPYKDLNDNTESGCKNIDFSSRATGFEGIENSNLGFVALYDNDHFKGKNIMHGLDDFHFTWNLPKLKQYDMNDKITSIAVAYNGDAPNVCSVLTIWDDSDYNFGDNNRKKHRISIVASKYNTRTSLPDLKKVKKIGSSKSWNDCISSISFHFGYADSFLLDY